MSAMEASDWHAVVAGRLEALGFRALATEMGPDVVALFGRSESWGRLFIALGTAVSPVRAAGLVAELREMVKRVAEEIDQTGEAGAHVQPLVLLLVLPFARLSLAEAERYQGLAERDPAGAWAVIPWLAELDAGLVDQHRGFPPVDPAVAAALVDPVPGGWLSEKEPVESGRDAERVGSIRQAVGRAAAGRQVGQVDRIPGLGRLDDVPVTRIILALNICVYLFLALKSGSPIETLFTGPSAALLYQYGANNTYLFGLGGKLLTTYQEPWRLLTSAFLHGGLLHIALNMASLWSVGRYVEVIFGSRRLLYIYLVSAVGGSIASVVFRGTPVLGVGASGAILGLMGAIIYFARSLKGARVDWAGLLTPLGITLLYGLLIPQIDNVAHVGGFAAGYLAAYLVGAPGERRPWKIPLAFALGLGLLLILLGVIPLVRIL
jgi:membrane associated rhomboid family serine protease